MADLSPKGIFVRIQNRLESGLEDICIDGSSDYQRGFFEGYRLAMATVKTEEGNLACQVTAERSRRMEQEGNQ